MSTSVTRATFQTERFRFWGSDKSLLRIAFNLSKVGRHILANDGKKDALCHKVVVANIARKVLWSAHFHLKKGSF